MAFIVSGSRKIFFEAVPGGQLMAQGGRENSAIFEKVHYNLHVKQVAKIHNRSRGILTAELR